MDFPSRKKVARALSIAFASSLASCAAIYPELRTPMRPMPEGSATGADVIGDLQWIAIRGAIIPPEGRDGRRWQTWGSSNGLPDPYALLFLNDKLLLRTAVQSNTLEPTWPGSPQGNIHLGPHDRLRIEIWDSNAINDHPMGIRDLGEVTPDQRDDGEVRAELDSGVEVTIAVEPPHAKLGLGFSCESRDPEVFVTHVFDESPASRAGLKEGDQILQLDNKPVQSLKLGELKSTLNMPHVNGLAMRIRHADGTEVPLVMKEGPIYLLFDEAKRSLP